MLHGHQCLESAKAVASGRIRADLIVENDGPYYIALAERLLAGNWIGALNDYWSQFYPIMIALISFFTKDTELAARLVSALCGAALVPVVWLLVKEIADSSSANIAALLIVFQPWLIVSSVLPLTEMLFSFLMTIALVFILRAARCSALWRLFLYMSVDDPRPKAAAAYARARALSVNSTD